LPVTLERRWEDNPTYDSYYPAGGTDKVPYKEGVFVGYRGYEHNKTKPLFPFGFGLSYTTFKYGNLVADEHGVTFDVTNTGSRTGDAVPEVYIAPEQSSVPRPTKELKGFARASLQPDETKSVKIPLNGRSFAYWSGNAWKVEKGNYDVLVGSSSDRTELQGKINLPRDFVIAYVRTVTGYLRTDVGSLAQGTAVESASRVRVSQRVAQALVLTRVPPVYPAEAKTAKIQGSVVLGVMIAEDGSVKDLNVISSASPLLNRAALDAVRQWKFKGYVLNGNHVEVDTQIAVDFTVAGQ
jgi:TonB family protein